MPYTIYLLISTLLPLWCVDEFHAKYIGMEHQGGPYSPKQMYTMCPKCISFALALALSHASAPSGQGELLVFFWHFDCFQNPQRSHFKGLCVGHSLSNLF